MNLSPTWVDVFRSAGWEADHWGRIGAPDAPDVEIMNWARKNGSIVFTHDLDFGAILAASGAKGPSVIQLRGEDTRPVTMGRVVSETMYNYRNELAAGALVTINPRRSKVTILPLRA